ncbi:MAG: TIM44-like domain-containing protein [Xanthobacteraceae bacterium]|nr:TIM44-like domain-containing protein [Xanthobacteraceae bacterium]
MTRFGRVLATFGAATIALALVAGTADARLGGGSSFGSRGTRTFSSPAPTQTAPSMSPLQRSVTQPSAPGYGSARPGGGFFNRGLFGGGLLGGLAAGFLGAGLFGLLFGSGFFGGLGGFASLLGLLIQIGLVVIVARLVWSWWQRRQQPAFAGPGYGRQSVLRDNGTNLGGGGTATRPSGPTDQVGITAADYDAFERLLGETQAAYSSEDLSALRARVSPEMLSYFAEDLARNTSRGVVNRISDVKLLQGDLAEAWREGSTDYATVAMKFSLTDQMLDRATGRVVEGDAQPQVTTEVWTFRRERGGNWLLSAIQQA